MQNLLNENMNLLGKEKEKFPTFLYFLLGTPNHISWHLCIGENKAVNIHSQGVPPQLIDCITFLEKE